MNDSNLTKEDYKLLQKIVVITRSILNNYYCLVELENSNEIDIKEYNKIVSELQTCLEMENELYKSIDKYYKIQDYLFFLNGNGQEMFENYLFMIFDNNNDKLIKSRISSKLDFMLDTMSLTEDSPKEEAKYEDEEDRDEEEYEIEEDEEFNINEQELLAMNRIQISIEDDIINTVIKLVNDSINNPQYERIKRALVEYKYILIYLFGDIEKEWVKNNFKVNDNLIWAHKMIGDYYRLTDNIINTQIEDYCEDLLTEARELLLSLLDSKFERIDDIKNSSYYIDIIIFSIIARSCLLFISEDLAKSYLSILKSDIDDIESKNETVIPFINSIIDSYKSDIEIPSVLRLRK